MFMNTNRFLQPTVANPRTFSQQCLASCTKLIAQIAQVKERILAEFRETFQGREHLFQLALNEAEALAWQTPYPQLVFPTLATEKVQALARWDAHQRALWKPDSSWAFAA
jgi:hypothetical protein